MKWIKGIFLLFFFLFQLQLSAQEIKPLDRVNATRTENQEAALSLSKGEAKDAEQYYTGVLACLLLIESDLDSVEVLDEADAKVATIETVIHRCLEVINISKSAIELYKNKIWPLLDVFQAKTAAWLNAVKGLCITFLNPLAEPMSRPDKTWTTEELKLYENYQMAYEKYLDIDDDWVSYQYTFAKANGFELEDEESTEEE